MKKSPLQTITPSCSISLVNFGQRINQQRKLAKMTVESLCERVGISRSTYARLVKGDPGICIGTAVECLNILGLIDHFDEVAVTSRNDDLDVKLKEHLPSRVRNTSRGDF